MVFPSVIVHKVGRVDPLCVIHKNRETPDCFLCLWGADQVNRRNSGQFHEIPSKASVGQVGELRRDHSHLSLCLELGVPRQWEPRQWEPDSEETKGNGEKHEKKQHAGE